MQTKLNENSKQFFIVKVAKIQKNTIGVIIACRGRWSYIQTFQVREIKCTSDFRNSFYKPVIYKNGRIQNVLHLYYTNNLYKVL